MEIVYYLDKKKHESPFLPQKHFQKPIYGKNDKVSISHKVGLGEINEMDEIEGDNDK